MPRLFFAALVACFCLLGPLYAAADTRVVKAGVYASPPFVMTKGDGVFFGMAIELWEAVEKKLGFQTEYVQYRNLNDLLDATRNGEVDVAVTNLTVTHELASEFKISFPWYDAGLRIMTTSDYKGSVLAELENSGQLALYALFGFGLIVLTIIYTIFKRRRTPEFPKEWPTGLSLSFYDLVVSAKAGALKPSQTNWLANFFSAIWMLVGVAIIAYVTSTLTTAMTTTSLSSSINTLSDLHGKTVAVFSGSAAEDYLEKTGFHVILFDDMRSTAKALEKRSIQAVVADAPVLEYWAHTNPDSGLEVVGNLFHPAKYAFAANPDNAAFMEEVSLELIRLHEIGARQEIRQRYLGNIDY